jgi:redox-sensitive bicupin YhaK (pirin superfamily)
MSERGISRVVTLPPPAPGFMGAGHTAVPVLDPNDFERNDPFILLMDDRIDLAPGTPAGGAHPHGGFETVTFVVEGTLRDRDEGNLEEGDILWMTAGSGVIHNEDVEPFGKSRILQLWLTLPQSARWTEPRFELIKRDEVPVRREDGVEARVYSGSSGSVRGPAHNYVPVTLVDVRLDSGATFDQSFPDNYNGFLLVLEGSVSVGERAIEEGQVGWLDHPPHHSEGECALRIVAGPSGARVMIYAGERQSVPIVMHGPFIAENRADLMRLSRAYIDGKMPRVSELPITKQ